MSIDFSKAPEGATHYELDGGFAYWYKIAGGELHYRSVGGWLISEYAPHEVELFKIPDVEPFISVKDTPQPHRQQARHRQAADGRRSA